jgi:hypothetical protein
MASSTTLRLSLACIACDLVFDRLHAQLNSTYYATLCPKALSTVKVVVKKAVANEKRMAASLLRLHFHDCFNNVSFAFKLVGRDLLYVRPC